MPKLIQKFLHYVSIAWNLAAYLYESIPNYVYKSELLLEQHRLQHLLSHVGGCGPVGCVLP